MQPTYSAEAEAYREKVQAFLAEKLPSNWQGTGALEGDELDQFVAEWRATLYEAKYPYGAAPEGCSSQPDLFLEFASYKIFNPLRSHSGKIGPNQRLANLDRRIFLLRIGQIGEEARDGHYQQK